LRPSGLAKLEAKIREIANELIDEFIADGAGDLGVQYGCELPCRVITYMLGLDQADAPKLSLWFRQATDLPAPGEDPEVWSQNMLQGAGNMWIHLAAAMEERKTDPRDDILTDVSRGEVDGEPIGDAAVGMCFLLYAAGEDTTVGLITTMIKELAEPEYEGHRRLLVEDPSRIPAAIDEFLRWDGPFLHLARVTTEDVTVRDVTIPADARVLLLWASANRDERQYDSPEILDFDRKRVAHLGFGHGLHHCIGHALAKIEARVAMEVLLERIPGWTIGGPIVPGNKPFIRGYRGLPSTFPAGGKA
jgi:cytochrome P450